MKIKFLLILIIFYNLGFSQNKKPKKIRITYTGIILDENREPLPFVNIYFKPDKKGTTSDINGEFKLELHRKRGKLTFSLMGYETKTIKIKPKNTYVKIILKEQKNVLDEVVIVKRPKKRLKKKENPAYPILKEIWKRKNKSGLKLLPKYEYKKYETTTIGLNRLDSVFLKKLFKKDFKSILKKLPYDDEGFHYYIPIYVKEQVFKIYGNNKFHKKRQDIIAEKEKGFNRQGYGFDRMSLEFSEVNIFDNSFSIFNKPFISPIAKYGFDVYDYLLYDTIQRQGRKFYNIYFFPRREGDLAFEGNFLVSADKYDITNITMKLKNSANLNFVRSVEIEKEYKHINDSIYLPVKDEFSADYTLLSKSNNTKAVNIKKEIYYSDYNFNKTYPPDFYDKINVKYKANQFKKDSLFWKKYSDKNQITKTYQLIDEVKGKRRIKTITNWMNILTTGYLPLFKNIQFGPVFQAIGRNGVEGIRLLAGFRTFKTPDDRFRAYGHIAYGLKDKKMKYELVSKYLLSYQPRIETELTLSDDYKQNARQLMNLHQLLHTNNFGSNFILSRGKNVFISHVKNYALKFDYKIIKNFHIGIIPYYTYTEPADNHLFNIDYLNNNGNIKHHVTDTGADIYVTYTPGRFVYGYGIEQKFGKNAFPTFVLNYRKAFGFNDVDYQRLQFKYAQKILMGRFGSFDLDVNLGKTFGKVPVSLLNPIPANQIMILKPHTFTLLNYYDFVTDTYAVGFFEYHLNGLIFNRLPLLRKLKLRTVLAYRIAYGTISDENKAINRSNIAYAAPDTKPYYEYSVGLENLGFGNLRIFRLDAVWRSHYTSINGLHSPKFALRLAIKPNF